MSTIIRRRGRSRGSPHAPTRRARIRAGRRGSATRPRAPGTGPAAGGARRRGRSAGWIEDKHRLRRHRRGSRASLLTSAGAGAKSKKLRSCLVAVQRGHGLRVLRPAVGPRRLDLQLQRQRQRSDPQPSRIAPPESALPGQGETSLARLGRYKWIRLYVGRNSTTTNRPSGVNRSKNF